jgi:NCS1 family nucleobase:cation symporter-1
MTPTAAAELRADVHSIEPIPERDKDSTGPQQMWIWAGANIAPINWALGALGIDQRIGRRSQTAHFA